nr:MAG TPA: hypothetical protein [Crassvirales sp.]
MNFIKIRFTLFMLRRIHTIIIIVKNNTVFFNLSTSQLVYYISYRWVFIICI